MGGMNPEMMQQMMNSPVFQQMLQNPETLRNLVRMNPEMNQLLENQPEMARLLDNPEILQQSINVMRNPAMMRAMMQQQAAFTPPGTGQPQASLPGMPGMPG